MSYLCNVKKKFLKSMLSNKDLICLYPDILLH